MLHRVHRPLRRPGRCLTVLGRHGRWPRGRGGFGALDVAVVTRQQVAHGHAAQRYGDAVDADFEARAEALGLEVVLGAESAGTLGDYVLRVRYVVFPMVLDDPGRGQGEERKGGLTLKLEIVDQGLLLGHREAWPRLLDGASVVWCSHRGAALRGDYGLVGAWRGSWA